MASMDRGQEILDSMHLESFSYSNGTEDHMVVEDYPYTVQTKEDMQYERIAAAFCIMFIATILATYLTIELSNCIKKSSWVRRWQSQSFSDEAVVVQVHRSQVGFPPPYRPNDQQTATTDPDAPSDANNVLSSSDSIVDLRLPANLNADEILLRIERSYGIGTSNFLQPLPSYNQLLNNERATETA